MISDLGDNEHEDEGESERAVEMLGLRDIDELGPPALPVNDASFGDAE
jgi:hypothetical protein